MLKRFEATSSSSSSTSGSSSGSETDDQESAAALRVGKVELVLNQLHAFAEDSTEQELSKFAENGKSKERIKQAMNNVCKCDAKCGKRISFAHVVAAATLFWSLPKSGQDCVLWSMQSRHVKGLWEEEPEEESSASGSDSDHSTSSYSSRSRSPRRRTMNKWYIEGSEQSA